MTTKTQKTLTLINLKNLKIQAQSQARATQLALYKASKAAEVK